MTTAAAWGGPWPIFCGVFWLAVLALGVFWLTRHRRWGHGLGQPGHHDRQSTEYALAILRERFARGEIDEEEYLRRRSTLDSL